jgi:hypothetical protein
MEPVQPDLAAAASDARWRRRARTSLSGASVTTLLPLLAACATASPGGASAAPAPSQRSATAAESGAAPGDSLVAPGFGTLKQDEFTVELRSGSLLVKVTPLAEEVTRLAAPDTYARLHALASRWRPLARRNAGVDDPELFLVSFFSYDPDVPFQPEDLQLTHQGRLIRPAAIYAVTPGWGKQRLAQQEVETAVYAFAGPINYELPIVVRYALEQSDHWSDIVPVLDSERARVRARAASRGR